MDKPGRILIVDNLEVWREVLAEILRRGGFHADSASRVTEALELLNDNLYHVLVIDIRMHEPDHSNTEGINLLQELEKRGLSEATKVIMLSAYGTKEQMRIAFRQYKVADFLSKDEFTQQVFLESVRWVFSEKVNINLGLEIYWQLRSRPEQAVLNLEVGGIPVKRGTLLHNQLSTELEDLLCRLFYQAKSIQVRPLTSGRSGTGVLLVQPFYSTRGIGQEVIVKFGDFSKIEEEYNNFKEYVQPFLGGGRNTTILDVRRTPHLGGIIYSLLGRSNDRLVDFGEFYRHADPAQIRTALNLLFRETCGGWYENHGPLQLLDLTADYQRSFGYTPRELEQAITKLKSVQGKQKLSFKSLNNQTAYTNPLLAIAEQPLICPTYVCTTHGDFNQHNLLVDGSGHVWLIDFQGTGQSHILRDVSTLDSTIRFQLLTKEEASLEERLQMEKTLLDNIERFSQVEQLAGRFSTQNPALTKAYDTVVHLRTLAHKLVEQSHHDDISEYYIALLYNALNTLRFSSLPSGQREHAVLCASLLADRLGLNS